MKCTILIEEETVAEALAEQLSRFYSPSQIARLNHSTDLLKGVVNDRLDDIYFLQIGETQVEELDQWLGCEVVPWFVFILSENCALRRSMDAASLDYLTWPWSMSDIRNLMARLSDLEGVISEYDSFGTDYKSAVQFFVSAVRNGLNGEIILPDVKGYKLFSSFSLARLESEGLYTHVFMDDGNRILTNKPLKHFDAILDPAHFVRIQSNQMINLNCIKHWKMDKDLIVTLKDDSEWKVSFRWVPLFINAVNAQSKNGLA